MYHTTIENFCIRMETKTKSSRQVKDLLHRASLEVSAASKASSSRVSPWREASPLLEISCLSHPLPCLPSARPGAVPNKTCSFQNYLAAVKASRRCCSECRFHKVRNRSETVIRCCPECSFPKCSIFDTKGLQLDLICSSAPETSNRVRSVSNCKAAIVDFSAAVLTKAYETFCSSGTSFSSKVHTLKLQNRTNHNVGDLQSSAQLT